MHKQMLMMQRKAGGIRRRLQLGATLTELLIATVIFGFLTMILLGVINFGSNSWRNLEGRSSAQKEIRLALLDLTKSVRNTDIRSFSCGNTTNTAGKTCNWMCFKTFQAIELYKPETMSFDSSKSGENRFRPTYFVLYYAIQPGNCGCSSAENVYADVDGNAAAAPDGVDYGDLLNTQTYKCPHKYLIKKYLSGFDATVAKGYPWGYNGSDPLVLLQYGNRGARQYLKGSEVKPYLTETTVPSQVNTSNEKAIINTNPNSVKLVAKNILVLAVNYYDPFSNRGDTSLAGPPALPEVQFTIKTFKIMENRKYNLGAGDLNLGGAKTLSLQVDEKIIPSNNNCLYMP
jgi:type II secretory pathway pseudopilin PulG